MALNMNRRLIPATILTLTAAQLAALYTTPIKIISGADIPDTEFLQFLTCLLVYNPGDTPFTIGSATNFAIKYGAAGPSASGTVAATGLIDQADYTGALLQPVSGLIVPQGDLYLTLAGGNPSGGDGTLGVKLLYRDPVMRVLEDDF